MGRDLRNCGQGTPLGAVVNAGPAARGLLITVRTSEPVEAVMVTVVEFVALQLSVTLCPFVIVFSVCGEN